MDTDERRLHPSSLFFQLLGHGKGLIIPALLVLVLSSGDRTELWLGVLIVPSMIFETWRYLTFRYRLDPDALVVREGLFFRSQRHIPFDRIQSVDLSRGPLERMFGVAEVRIETAGGTEPEAQMKVVSLEHVEELRRRIFRGREVPALEDELPFDGGEDGGAPEQVSRKPAPATLLRLRGRDLLLLGLDLGRGIALVFVALGLAYEFGLFERFDLEEQVDSLRAGAEFRSLLIGVGLAAVGLLLLVFLLSLAWTVVRLSGFSLSRRGDDFRLSCGLLTRLEATIPRHRIQLVSVRRSWLQRRLGRASVVVETAGGGQAEGREASPSRRWFAPLVREGALGALLREIDPALELEGLDWRPLSARGRRRMCRRAVITAVLLTGLTFLMSVRVGLIATLVIPAAFFLLARAESRFMAHARTPWGLVFRSGALTRRWSATWPDRAQVLALHETPFDRRHRMARLAVDTAGAGPAQHRIVVPYMARAEAEALQAEFSHAAQSL